MQRLCLDGMDENFLVSQLNFGPRALSVFGLTDVARPSTVQPEDCAASSALTCASTAASLLGMAASELPARSNSNWPCSWRRASAAARIAAWRCNSASCSRADCASNRACRSCSTCRHRPQPPALGMDAACGRCWHWGTASSARVRFAVRHRPAGAAQPAGLTKQWCRAPSVCLAAGPHCLSAGISSYCT